MSIPLPETPLGSHCSVIRENTLYTFSESAFQSLELKNGSVWKTLPLNIGTRGAACVIANRGKPDESLYIVGGSTTDPNHVPAKGYMGLQRWYFGTKKWETVSLPDTVAFNLTGHGASFVESIQRILVFGGSAYPAPGVPSASAFLLQATSPHEITALPAQRALLSPIVLPWGDDGALVVGGDVDNKALNVYTASSGSWNALAMQLDAGLPAKGSAWASLMGGDDGSRALLTFDLTTSPATVVTKIVKAADKTTKTKRNPAAAADPVVSTKNQLTADNWPKYNSSGAPAGPREHTSLAYDGDMVVISGGDEKQPLLMFNARKNTWVSAESIFGPTGDDEVNFRTDSSSSGSPTTMAGPTASASSIAGATVRSASAASSLNTIQLLFVILGSILGVVFFLAAILFFLRQRRRQNLARGGLNDGARGGKSRMSFQDRGASFMKEAGGSLSSFPERTQSNRGPNDSWLNIQRQASTKAFSPSETNFIGGPQVHRVGGQGVIVHPGQQPPTTALGDRGVSGISGEIYGKERGSGWSRYFSSNSATNLVTEPARVYSGAPSSVYTDVSRLSGPHQNPFIYSTDHTEPLEEERGMGIVSVQRTGSNGILLDDPRTRQEYSHHYNNTNQERRGSDISLSSMGSVAYSSGVPESMMEKPLWSKLDRDREVERDDGGNVSSSVYPESRTDDRRETDVSGYSGVHQQRGGIDDLSWLNLRHG